MERSAEEILRELVKIVIARLDILNELELIDFLLGEKTAYVDCLELIQTRDNPKKYGLDYRIEDVYKI